MFSLLTKFYRLSLHDTGNSRHLIKETFTLDKSQSDIRMPFTQYRNIGNEH